MTRPGGRLQVLRLEVLLTGEAPAPREVARELSVRLNRLPYVVEAKWSPDVFEEEGNRYLRGVVSMPPMEELPEDDPELKTFYDCFDLPGVVGPGGRLPATLAGQTEFTVEEFDRLDQDKRLRAALRHHEELQRQFFDDNPDLSRRFVMEPPLGPIQIEVCVALNALWEQLDAAANRKASTSDPEEPGFEFEQGRSAGLRRAGEIVLNEMTRRRLHFIASATG